MTAAFTPRPEFDPLHLRLSVVGGRVPSLTPNAQRVWDYLQGLPAEGRERHLLSTVHLALALGVSVRECQHGLHDLRLAKLIEPVEEGGEA